MVAGVHGLVIVGGGAGYAQRSSYKMLNDLEMVKCYS